MERKKVLIVDDEIHIIQVVAIKLRNNNYDVITACNGAEAFKLACAENPDIIISDVQMPPMTGLEFVDKLRQNDQTKDTPVIMLTARSFNIEDEQKQSLGISELIGKPFSPRELVSRVRAVLRRTETESSLTSGIIDVDNRLKLDFNRREIWINDKLVQLRPTEYRLLYHLVTT